MSEQAIDALGQVLSWPGGYAMSLGLNTRGVARCCEGHETPSEAKAHGLIRLVETASGTADRDVRAWAEVDASAT